MPPDRPAVVRHPGALLAETHDLGGLPVRVRLARPSDAPRLRRMLEGLSPDSRRRRFASPTPVVRERIVRHFAYYDPRRRHVLAATTPADGTEAVIGLADVALAPGGAAELAVVVAEGRRRRGVGRLLAEAAADLAARTGARSLKGDLRAGGAPALALMQALGPTVRTVEDGAPVAYTSLAPRLQRPLRSRPAAAYPSVRRAS